MMDQSFCELLRWCHVAGIRDGHWGCLGLVQRSTRSTMPNIGQQRPIHYQSHATAFYPSMTLRNNPGPPSRFVGTCLCCYTQSRQATHGHQSVLTNTCSRLHRSATFSPPLTHPFTSDSHMAEVLDGANGPMFQHPGPPHPSLHSAARLPPSPGQAVSDLS